MFVAFLGCALFGHCVGTFRCVEDFHAGFAYLQTVRKEKESELRALFQQLVRGLVSVEFF